MMFYGNDEGQWILGMILARYDSSEEITSWEVDFLRSVERGGKTYKDFSQKQQNVISRIADKMGIK